MKYLLLALPILLAGCSTVQLVEPVENKVQLVEKSTSEPTELVHEIIEIVEIEPAATPATVNTEDVKTTSVIEKVKSAVSTAKKVKKTVDEIKAVWEDNPAPNNTPPENLPTQHTPDMAPPYDYKTGTGAKVSLFGVGMEFWLGNNDSWSTVLKLLVLLLVTYGGFKYINYFFDKKNNLKIA